jgi:hypothetical protein
MEEGCQGMGGINGPTNRASLYTSSLFLLLILGADSTRT